MKYEIKTGVADMKCEGNATVNPALEKSFDFALRIVKLYRHLSERKGVKYEI